MNIGRNNYKYLLAALSGMLLTASSAKAQGTGSFQPVQCINMQTATFSVPSPEQVVTPPTIPMQLFDVGQKSSIPVTIDATWTPTADGASGILEFLADGKQPQCQSFYSLQISPSQVSISLVQGRTVTGLGTAPISTSKGVPVHFQLIENNGVFTVVNPATQNVLLTVSDSTITSNPALCLGTDIKGKWSFSAMQNKTGGTPPVLPNGAVASVPNPGADDDNGQTLSKVTHIGYPSPGSMTVTFSMTSMVAPPTPGPIGHVTSHREYGPNFSADDYSVFLFADRVAIGKTIQGTFYSQATGKYPTALATPIVANEPVLLQMSTKDNSDGSVTISLVYTPTNQVIAHWTDSGWGPNNTTVAPYTNGFQFGIYTDVNSAVCWDQVLMYPQ